MESSNLPPLSPLSEEGSDDHPSAFSSIPDRPATKTSAQKYAPLEWSGYFDQEDDVSIPGSNDVFHVYMAGSQGPVVFCLHGGGYSGLSFALAASQIKEKTRVVAMDLRGHGKSSTDNDLDLSIETLCNDVVVVLKTLYGDSPPAIVLVGHSMGGSVAVHVAIKKVIPSLAGLIVVDVVEGTAMASLIHMQKILSSRMQHFHTIEKAVQRDCVTVRSLDCFVDPDSSLLCAILYSGAVSSASLCSGAVSSATPIEFTDCSFVGAELTWSNHQESFHIEWSVKGGSLRNVESARVSVPPTLKYDDAKKCYTYRTRLEETEQYWKGWYEGLSEKFLSCPVPKLLLLAGTDRLDRTLTIGQMQGKFQMVVVRHTGHAIQEDVPDEFASLVLNFISRNRLGPHGVEIPGLRRPSQQS